MKRSRNHISKISRIGSGTRSEDGDSIRIIDAALGLFANRDISDVTMRAIAQEAGISVAEIYRLFRSKDDLLYSIADKKAREMNRQTMEHLGEVVSAKEKLITYTRFLLNFCESDIAFASFLVTVPISVWHDVPFDGAMREQARILVKILEEGKMRGEVKPNINIGVVIRIYFGGIERLIHHWFATNREEPLSNETDGYIDLMISGIGLD